MCPCRQSENTHVPELCTWLCSHDLILDWGRCGSHSKKEFSLRSSSKCLAGKRVYLCAYTCGVGTGRPFCCADAL